MDVTVVDPSRVVLAGRLDARSVGDVRMALHALLPHGTGDLVVDVAAVEVADATGLGMLVGLHRSALRIERRVLLSGVPPRLHRLLRATKLHRILRLVPEEELLLLSAPVHLAS
jgi:anti-sigma B factor antagonist